MPTDNRTLLAVWALAEARRLRALAPKPPKPVVIWADGRK